MTRQTKSDLRAHFLKKRAQISEKDHLRLSQSLCEQLRDHPRIKEADLILGYQSFGKEPQLQAFYDSALISRQAQTLAFPRSENGQDYHFAQISCLETDLELGALKLFVAAD